jgi:predicted phosphodiesterase
MMRTAILSDIHGNRTAFEAVLGDLQQASPDLILHGGDLADAGASPVEIVDHIRDLGWPGVVGNTDELVFRPESLDEFANQSSAPASLWTAIRQMAAAIRSLLGEERIAWLRGLPRVHIEDQMALVHASPENLWRAPAPEATDAELEAVYGPLRRPATVYGHIHRPYIRSLTSPDFREGFVANAGSVGLPYDGDRRASYLLFDDSGPTIRRVEYDVESEIKALSTSRLPHADWIAKTLQAAFPQMP